MFPDDFQIQVRRHRDGAHYTASTDDPFPVAGTGPSIVSALMSWCQALASEVRARQARFAWLRADEIRITSGGRK